MKLKKGDNVIVLSGNDKGKTGEVLEVIPKTEKVVVKGVNIRKKHVKPRKAGEEGGIIPSEFPVHSSIVNVVCPKCGHSSIVNVVCPKCGKATRIGYKTENDKKVRICKKCGAEIK